MPFNCNETNYNDWHGIVICNGHKTEYTPKTETKKPTTLSYSFCLLSLSLCCVRLDSFNCQQEFMLYYVLHQPDFNRSMKSILYFLELFRNLRVQMNMTFFFLFLCHSCLYSSLGATIFSCFQRRKKKPTFYVSSVHAFSSSSFGLDTAMVQDYCEFHRKKS